MCVKAQVSGSSDMRGRILTRIDTKDRLGMTGADGYRWVGGTVMYKLAHSQQSAT